MGSLNQLYRVFEPGQKHPFVFMHCYAGDIEVSIRPFFSPEDLMFFNLWLNEEFGKKVHPPSNFDASYFHSTLLSTNTQSLWGVINGQPSFQAELHQASENQPPFREKSLLLSDGDVILHLIIAPHIIDQPLLAATVLPACMDHCFNHSGVERVLLVTEKQDLQYGRLAEEALPSSQLAMKNGKSVYIYEPVSNH